MTSFRTQGESEWADYNDLMHYVLGFMLFFSTFSMIYVMSDILKEKKQHIFQRNLVTPINRASQLFAKMFVTFLLGFVQISIILLAGKYLFHIHWGGNLGILLLISACYILTFTCLGLFLSSIVKSYDQLGALSPIILVSTAMLGGCMWPIELITNKGLLIFEPNNAAALGAFRHGGNSYARRSAVGCGTFHTRAFGHVCGVFPIGLAYNENGLGVI